MWIMSRSEPESENGGADTRGLGDLAEAFFKSLGITEERYQAVKVSLHLDPKCNCADRKRWLNEVGAELGVNSVVVKMAQWMDRRKGGGGKGEGGR